MSKKKKHHSLVDKIYSSQNLKLAWEKVRVNKGSAGVDRITITNFAENQEAYLDELHRQLKEDNYRPKPVKRVMIPKADGKKRPLGIPTVKDRVVQQAVLNRLESIWEEIFLDVSFGFRKGRSTHQAMRYIWNKICSGYVWIVDLDIQAFFDTIPQDKIMELVAREISDGRVLRLIKKFLRAGIMDGSQFQKSVIGTPQGGVISPLLANIVLHEFDVRMVRQGIQMARYADDAVLLCRTKEEALTALAYAKFILEKELGLKVHPTKTRIVHITQGFEFLGYLVKRGQTKYRYTNRGPSLYAMPRKKSIDKFKNEIRRITKRTNPKKLSEVIAELNPVIRGWGNYYRKAHVRRLFWRLDTWIRLRLYSFITKRWRSLTWRKYSSQRLYGEFKLVRLFTLIPGMAAKVS